MTCSQPFNSDTKVRIEFPDHTRFYYPDAMVVCQSNPDSDHFQTQPVVTLHRRLPEGGFTIERHSGLDAIIPLPEIEASLSLADLYERVEFAP